MHFQEESSFFENKVTFKASVFHQFNFLNNLSFTKNIY